MHRPDNRRLAIPFIVALSAPLLAPASASAELIVNGGVEYFRWTENTSPQVKETGPMGFIGLSFLQDKDAGVLFGYRGKVWGGSADYSGANLFTNAPLTSTTDYFGINNELQARYRKAGTNGGSIDGVFGLGLDLWRRTLSTVQKEDYSIGYARVGVESKANYGGQWLVGLGIKYPLWTYENAHFDKIGFDSNPILHPGKQIAPYASIGYRFTPKFQLVGYYEGLRFDRSDPVVTNEVAHGLGPTSLVQPASNMSIFGLRFEYILR
ncbi:MAG: hypothetical protein ABI771_11370 [Betaproteobacteria bacterium]